MNMLICHKKCRKWDGKEKGSFMHIDFAVSVKGKGKISSNCVEFALKRAVIVEGKKKTRFCFHSNSSCERSGCKKTEDSRKL